MDALADFQKQAPAPGPQAERLADRDRELSAQLVEVEAGGGAVRVRVDGRGRLRYLALDAAAFERRDAELLADLILGAVAEGQRRAADGSATERPAGTR
jgi:DNA-binding protein YbaB